MLTFLSKVYTTKQTCHAFHNRKSSRSLSFSLLREILISHHVSLCIYFNLNCLCISSRKKRTCPMAKEMESWTQSLQPKPRRKKRRKKTGGHGQESLISLCLPSPLRSEWETCGGFHISATGMVVVSVIETTH